MSTTPPRPEHPRPDFEREHWLNLNGEWEFEIDPGNSGAAKGLTQGTKLADAVQVPFCPESPLSGIGNIDFMNAVWYRRKVKFPSEWEGQRVLLHFGAVDYEATVWVNGREAVRHRGGYVPFCADITPYLDSGNTEIVVRAVDDTRDPHQPTGKQCHEYHSMECLYRRCTGIWQTVYAEAAGETALTRVHLQPSLETGLLIADVDVDGPPATLVVKVKDGKKTVAQASRTVRWRGNTVVVEVPEVRAWSPADPHLYGVELTLTRNGQTVDRVTSYAGFRDLYIEGNRFYLNGELLYQRLVLDQGYYPKGIYTAPSDKALKKDISLSMAMGFNGARLHQKIFEPRFLHWADAMGYLVWGEYPDWGLDKNHPAAFDNIYPEWLAAVQRDRNHPSLIGWCPTNETPNVQRRQSIEHLYRMTRALDPSRPIIDASGYTHVVTDVDDNHDYTQDPEAFKARQDPLREGRPFRNRENDAPYQGQPFICSEYGGIWWNPGQRDDEGWGYGGRPQTEKEFIDRLKGLTDALLDNPGMAGFVYTQLTDVEQEVNGLYTFDRKPKFPAETIASIFQRQSAMENSEAPE